MFFFSFYYLCGEKGQNKRGVLAIRRLISRNKGGRRSFISVGIPDSMAYGQRESLSHLLSPVGYNVLSNLFITCLCLNVFFDRICKYLRISGDCLSGAVRKARNRIIKGRNRIASGGRIREFCNQRGVLELPAGFSALEKRGSRFDSSFSLSFFTCLELYVLFIFI